ncbi:hypothetical protein [Sulfurisoma sediminicola]|uniref:hypothetical protein n=1 Tax=Sulfurisoma sediminicola TaxID=1381557 RepID=UPI000F6050D0|nr:hypothetical protein [Sulfurisoma sediminicola]
MLLLAAGLWCISHPYVGMVEHDARVYSLLVAHWLSPEAYARDPFFLFGSQDRYSAFTPLYGLLASRIGLANAALAISALGGVLWVAAAATVARAVLDDRRLQAFALLCCAILSLNYSPNAATFVLNEGFPTARSIALPLGALSLGLAMHGHFRSAVLAALAATALHPLLGIWPLVFVVAHRLADRTILLLVLAAALLPLALNWAGASQMQRMDPAWESIARHSSRDLFVGTAGTARIDAILAWLSLLLWAGRLAAQPVGRWYGLGAVIGASGFLLAQIASYYYPAILIVQAQPWRAMWVAVFLGVFALAQLLGHAWRGPHRIWWAIGGLLLYILTDWAGYALFASCALLHPPLAERTAIIARRIDARARRFAPILLLGLFVAVVPGYVQDLTILGGGIARDFQSGVPLLDGFLLAGGLGVGALFLAWLATSALAPGLLLAGSATLFVFAAAHWDQRRDSYSAWEGREASQAAPLFGGAIRRGEVVLWPDAIPERVWHELGTANYGSSDQAIGGIFSREKTFELLRRRQRLAIASLAESWPLSAAEQSDLLNRYRRLTGERLDEKGNLHESYMRPINLTGPGMLFACEDPALDWVISPRPLAQPVLRPISTGESQGAWLYSCAGLRAVPQAPTFSTKAAG